MKSLHHCINTKVCLHSPRDFHLIPALFHHIKKSIKEFSQICQINSKIWLTHSFIIHISIQNKSYYHKKTKLLVITLLFQIKKVITIKVIVPEIWIMRVQWRYLINSKTIISIIINNNKSSSSSLLITNHNNLTIVYSINK